MGVNEAISDRVDTIDQEKGLGHDDRFKGTYQIVAFDLDTTGRLLVDEICQIGGHYLSPSDGQPQSFSQYVMPHKDPNPAARMSFGITVISNGLYRMLKSTHTGKTLSTKSEISALQDFLQWLKEAKGPGVEGVLLLCHEPNRKVVVPFLLQALQRYNLMEDFKQIVVGFVNGAVVTEKIGGKQSIITSNSLRSLCKTVLQDTSPATYSASDRAKLLMQIINKLVLSEQPGNDKDSENKAVEDCTALTRVATKVSEEEDELQKLKDVLSIESTLKDVFAEKLKLDKPSRIRAMALRRQLAKSGIGYQALEDIFKDSSSSSPEGDKEKISPQPLEDVKAKLKVKMGGEEVLDEDLDELVNIFKAHLDKVAKGGKGHFNSRRGKPIINGARRTFNNDPKPWAKNGPQHPAKKHPKNNQKTPQEKQTNVKVKNEQQSL